MDSASILTNVLLKTVEIPVRENLDLSNMQLEKQFEHTECPHKGELSVMFRDALNGFSEPFSPILSGSSFKVKVYLR